MSKEEENPSSLSLVEIVRELEDLVRLTLECEKKDIIPNVKFVQVHEQLNILREILNKLHQSYLETLKSFSMTENDVAKLRKNVDDLPDTDKKLLQRLGKLQLQCEEARDRVYESIKEHPIEMKGLKDELKTTKRKKSDRKGKFKGVGGKKNWMPT